LAYAEATGSDTLMTICNVCTLNLRQANWQLKNDPDLLARVNTNLETVGAPPYSGEVEVRHLLWLIAEGDGYELLKGVAHKGLKGLKIAPFYGCQILRPSKILGFEDPDKPWSLEAIIEACGGEPVDYPAKIKCCGFPIIQAREEVALGELIQPIEQAFEAGWVRLETLRCRLPGLPPELEGLRIAHLSDFHLGFPSRASAAIDRAVDWVEARQPDLTLISGDLLSRRAGEERLRCLLARLPRCFAVLGNHDFALTRDPFS